MNEIDKIKSVSTKYEDDILQLRKKYIELQKDLEVKCIESIDLQKDNADKQDSIEKQQLGIEKQTETISQLNIEVSKYIQ